MAKGKKVTDDELIAITDQEIANSFAYMSGRLSEQRRKAMYFYLAEPKGELSPPEVEGRSHYISTDVADTVEWMLPSLLKIFTASEHAVEFAPTRPEDEEAAKVATDYVNHIFNKQNHGFAIMYTWIKDALLQKNGIVKAYWDDKKDETKEEYKRLTEMELTMLLEDPEVEPINRKMYPDESAAEQMMQQYQQVAMQAQAQGQMPPPMPPMPQLYDVTVKRTKDSSQIRVENIPPEEFLIHKLAKSIADAEFCAHKKLVTRSDLVAMGYKNVNNLSSGGTDDSLNNERLERRQYYDDNAYTDEDTVGDESQARLWLHECYIKIDYDGSGIAEWRKVTRCGGQILDNEECDGPPFCSITPIPLPHMFFGLSIADFASDAQRVKTTLWRSVIDNINLQVNGRTFAVESQVNLDDLLSNRPGSIVRVKNPGAVGPLQQGMSDMGGALRVMEQAEVMKENRTGFTRYSQGNSADSLNDTATGINIITNRSDARTELIARVFAETGVKDLFLMILKLASQYQKQEQVVQIAGKWVNINPREWKNRFDFNVNVGLGTGNKDQVVQHLMALMDAQGKGLQIGIANPKNLYNSASKLAENLGFKQADDFFTDPSQQPPQQPQPSPEQIKAQADQQKMQFDAQQQQQKNQMDMQKAQLDHDRAIQEAHIKADNDYRIALLNDAREREKLEQQITLQREDMQNKYLLNMQVESMKYQQINQQTEAELNDGRTGAGIYQGAESGGITGQPSFNGGIPTNEGTLPPGMAG